MARAFAESQGWRLPPGVWQWPFAPICDSKGNPTRWVALHARVRSPQRMETLAGLLRSGLRLVGMTSDGFFPALDQGQPDPDRASAQPRQRRSRDAVDLGPSDADPLDYGALCEAWCHCFRDPERWLPPTPRALLSESDFTDYVAVGDAARRSQFPAPAVDVVCVTAATGWRAEAKGWELARRCLPILARQGITCLVVGARPGVDLNLPGVEVVASLPWPQLMQRLASARLLLATNGPDASPRVLAEALSLDVPLVVHEEILGGWKYVNRRTGVAFTGVGDVADAARTCLEGSWAPRDWYRTNHGPYLAGRRLLQLLAPLDPDLTERSHLLLGAHGVEGRIRSR